MSQQRRARAQRQAAAASEHEECLHIAAPPWGMGQRSPDQPPAIIGVSETCCWCGPLKVLFKGLTPEQDGGKEHGPFVRYEPLPVAAPAPTLLIPSGGLTRN